MSQTELFDRSLFRLRRDRCAPQFHTVNFLKKEACTRLADRLADVKRHFPLALDIGAHTGEMAAALAGHPSIGTLVQTDISAVMLAEADGLRVQCDDAWLPFKDDSIDLVMSALSLHSVNDLVGTLIQIRRILKPDGLALLTLPGAHTLWELRQALAEAETTVKGGISPRLSPLIDVRDAGNLLQRAGFSLPVADGELLDISYPHPLALMQELRRMGEANILNNRDKTPMSPALLREITASYPTNAEGRIHATVELVTLTAWKPHESQQIPAKRGSGVVSLKDVL